MLGIRAFNKLHIHSRKSRKIINRGGIAVGHTRCKHPDDNIAVFLQLFAYRAAFCLCNLRGREHNIYLMLRHKPLFEVVEQVCIIRCTEVVKLLALRKQQSLIQKLICKVRAGIRHIRGRLLIVKHRYIRNALAFKSQ